MTTTNSNQTVIKQTAAKNIAKALRTQHTARRDLTISALFSALVHADITFMAGFTKADAAMFDTTLRTMLPVQFKQKQGGYVYDRQKADKLRAELSVTFNETAWEEFSDKLLGIWLHGHQAAQAEEVDAQQKRQNASKSVQRSLEKALAAGLSLHELEVLFTKFKAANGGVMAADVFKGVLPSTQPETAQHVQH